MIFVLNGRDRGAHPELFEQQFRFRYEVFVRGGEWPAAADVLAVDRYDDDDAVYFLDLDDESRIRASGRITPTVTSSLIADCFPQLIENRQARRAPATYECNRAVAWPAEPVLHARHRIATFPLIAAMLEWCAAHDVAYLQTMIETVALSRYLELTPLTQPMGLSHPYGGGRACPGGGECMAIRWPVCSEVLADLRRYAGGTPGVTAAPAPGRRH